MVAVLMLPFILAPMFLLVPSDGVSLEQALGWGTGVGILVLVLWLTLRVPHSTVTWTLLVAVSGAIIFQASYIYLEQAATLGLPAVRIVFGGANIIFWLQIVLGLVVFPLIFPTGRPPTTRWNWVLWAAGIGLIPQIVKAIYLAVTLPVGGLVDGPTGSGWLDSAVNTGQAIIAPVGIAALGSLAVRFRRSVGVERQQIKWLLFPITFLVLFWLVDSISQESPLSLGLLLIGSITLPVALSIAVLRYRLYDIDRIVSRTVTYTLVVGLLVAVYTVGVALVTTVVPAESDLAVVASTLTAALLFTPLRRQVQKRVDRRFHRTRYSADHEVAWLTGKLRDTTDSRVMMASLGTVVERTLAPTTVGMWLEDLSDRPRPQTRSDQLSGLRRGGERKE